MVSLLVFASFAIFIIATIILELEQLRDCELMLTKFKNTLNRNASIVGNQRVLVYNNHLIKQIDARIAILKNYYNGLLINHLTRSHWQCAEHIYIAESWAEYLTEAYQQYVSLRNLNG